MITKEEIQVIEIERVGRCPNCNKTIAEAISTEECSSCKTKLKWVDKDLAKELRKRNHYIYDPIKSEWDTCRYNGWDESCDELEKMMGEKE